MLGSNETETVIDESIILKLCKWHQSVCVITMPFISFLSSACQSGQFLLKDTHILNSGGSEVVRHGRSLHTQGCPLTLAGSSWSHLQSRLSTLLTSRGSPKTWGDGFPLNVSPAPPVAWGWIPKPNPLLHLVVYCTPVTLLPQSNVDSLNLQVWYKATFTGWLVLSHDLAYQPETKHWLIWSVSQLE